VLFQKIPILPPWRFFLFETPPLWKFQYRLILSFKKFGLKDPSSLEFPVTLSVGGVDFFWNHTMLFQKIWKTALTHPYFETGKDPSVLLY